MKILIAGCGYLGRVLGANLVEKGREVWGLSRRPSGLEALGIHPLIADLTKPETLRHLPRIDHAVLAQAPSASDHYCSTYVEGARHMTQALTGKLSGKLILISSTRVYGKAQGQEGSWVDELLEPKPDDEQGLSLFEAERIILGCGIPSIVFRLGGIYGPGRNRIRQIRSGELVPEFSESYVNRIHVEDAAKGLELLMEKGSSGEVYLGVDDEPTTQNEFYSWLYGRLRLEKPAPSTRSSAKSHSPSNKRCSNHKLKNLGFEFSYQTYKEGYNTIIS